MSVCHGSKSFAIGSEALTEEKVDSSTYMKTGLEIVWLKGLALRSADKIIRRRLGGSTSAL